MGLFLERDSQSPQGEHHSEYISSGDQGYYGHHTAEK